MLRINLELLGPLVQQMGFMNSQIARAICAPADAPHLTNKPHRLKLELPSAQRFVTPCRTSRSIMTPKLGVCETGCRPRSSSLL